LRGYSEVPDNYAAVLAAGNYSDRHTPENPDQPFLPGDLFEPGGPWVPIILRGTGVTATVHTRESSGRSAFLVLLNLPGGREQTTQYIGALNSTPKFWEFVERDQRIARASRQLPQFPVGTQVALLRMMMVIDDTGQPVVTPITEGLQIRVYHQIHAVPAPARHGLRAENSAEEFAQHQAVHEFILRPRQLLAGQSSLQARGATDRALGLLLSHPYDPLSVGVDGVPRQPRGQVVLASCRACHSGPGIMGVQAVVQEFGTRTADAPSFSIRDNLSFEIQKTTRWKWRQFDWGLLRGYWESQATAAGEQ
jgi:hypothetical protein